jgi:signal transduction histidine kinase
MRTALHELTEPYSAALREYCAKAGEAGLNWAYQLGHRAASEGLGVLEMAAIHQKALVEAMLEMVAGDESTHIAHRASEFLAEALAPFEQRHRRYNQGLEQSLNATEHKLEAAQDQLLEQRRAEQRKNECIFVMSHEMHGSLSELKCGLGGELNADGQRLLDVTLRNSERVMRLVGDSPDVQTIESDTMTFNGTRTAAGSGSGSS